jgi:putative endonuclease
LTRYGASADPGPRRSFAKRHNRLSDNFYVYILASQRNGTLYVGVTNDLARRITEHKSGLVPGFTQQYGVDKLVYFEEHGSILEAREREYRMKR